MPPHPMMPPRVFDRPPLATGVVRYVGDPVAVVVGHTRAAAVDAAEAVEVTYDALAPVVDPAHAQGEDVPLLFPDRGSNVAAESVVVAALAMRLDRPVGWVQTRSENLTGMPHGRGQRQDAALGLRSDGVVVGLQADITCDAGGYPMLGALIPNATSLMLGGP